MSQFWLRNPQRDQLLGPGTLSQLLSQLPASDREEWANWQAMPAKGQSYSALRGEEGWLPLAEVTYQHGGPPSLLEDHDESNSAAVSVPEELDHMRPGIDRALKKLPESISFPPDAAWPVVLRQLIRHRTAYPALRTAAGLLAILLWFAIGLTSLWQVTAWQEGGIASGESPFPGILLPLAAAILSGLVVFILLQLVWLMCDRADQKFESLRQSGTAPGQVPPDPANRSDTPD